MSSDGKVVTGSIPGPSQNVPARWTKETGFVALESLSEPVDGGWARAANADGSVIVGQVQLPSGGGAFRWTEDEGIISLELGAVSIAEDVSANGGVIVGTTNGSADAHLFRWTSGTGAVDVATLGVNGEVVGTNAAGTVIVGSYQPDSGESTRAPFRWTASSLFQIGTDPGLAIDVSDDGTLTFGKFLDDATPFIYLLTGSMSGFTYPALEGLTGTYGGAMSGDARVIAGQSPEGIWIYDDVNGTRLLEDVLVALGADLGEWSLWDVASISLDGKILVGGAYRPSDQAPTGFIARL
jgi:hypothetical protein